MMTRCTSALNESKYIGRNLLYGSGETTFSSVSVFAPALSKSASFVCHSATLLFLSHAS